MLTKSERTVMALVYELCTEKQTCMVSAFDLLHMLPDNDYTIEGVEAILNTLKLDDYFEIIYTERKGEKVYIITLHEKGTAFKREMAQVRRAIYFKVALTVGGAILAFILGRILVWIFA